MVESLLYQKLLSMRLEIKDVQIKLIVKIKTKNTTVKFNSFCQEFYDFTQFCRIEKSSFTVVQTVCQISWLRPWTVSVFKS